MRIPSLTLIAFRVRARERRNVLKLSQQDLSARIADTNNLVVLSAKEINDIETQARGVSLDEALAIAEALLVQLDDLLTEPDLSARQDFGEPGVEAEREKTIASIARTGESLRQLGRRLAESEQRRLDLQDRERRRLVESCDALSESLHLVVGRLSTVEAELEHLELRLDRLVELVRNPERIHEDSLAGYGADRVSAPIATADAPTSAVGDTVRDATDTSSPPTAGRAE